MKVNKLIISSSLKLIFFALAFSGLSGCNVAEPEKEDVPELVTKARLTFTPAGGGSPVDATATDPDGEGVKDITTDGPIILQKNKTYTMTISLINGLAQVGEEGYDLSEEVEHEGHEHQFYFSWTNEVFSDPSGNGNIDNRSDPVNYTGGSNSKDVNNLPLGLTTTWTTASAASSSGDFRVLLKHQPNLKSDTSDSNTGETDLDLTFKINIH
jgi:hypothetical protein